VKSPGLPVPPPRNQSIHPVGCSTTTAALCIDFVLGSNIESDIFPSKADFQVCVEGVLDLPDRLIALEDHWRVDTDLKSDPEKPAREPHPYIHFQRGGHAQDAFAQKDGFVPGLSLPTGGSELWRGLLQSPGPRLPFLPMCPLLAIDFTVGQHDGLVWRRLRGEPNYLAIIRRAQSRLWDPFFKNMADHSFRRRWFGPIFL
jgi:hypothetical protein